MADPLLPDHVLAGRYRVVGPLGAGGMGQVVEALDLRLHRPVAVKVVDDRDPELGARVRAEALALARVRHPHVVAVYDAGEDDGRPFVVTELVRGRTLRAHLGADGPLRPAAAARLGSQLAAALACTHQHGIVHRDLKPGNVLVEDVTGDARLIDFGIATSEHATALTATGMVIGTPAYLAPEQVEGRRAGPAADVYALGLVLLEALTGERPFPGTPTETAAARLTAAPRVPEHLGDRWCEVLGAATRRDPRARPTSTQFAGALARLAEPSVDSTSALVGDPPRPPHHLGAPGATGATGAAGTIAAAPTGRRRRFRPAALAAAVACLVAVVVLGAAAARGGGADPEPDHPVEASPPSTATATSLEPVAATAPPPAAARGATPAPDGSRRTEGPARPARDGHDGREARDEDDGAPEVAEGRGDGDARGRRADGEGPGRSDRQDD